MTGALDPVSLVLLGVAGLLLAGVAAEASARATRIPDALWLIAAGAVLGPLTGVLPAERVLPAAPYLGALALVVLLFESGLKLRAGGPAGVAPRAAGLALAGFAASVAAAAAAGAVAARAGWLPSSWTAVHGALLGAILGGPSALLVEAAVAGPGTPPRVAQVLGLESALADALCIVGAAALVEILLADHGGRPLASAVGLGAAAGLVAGLVWLLFLRLLRAAAHAYPVTLAALLLVFVGVDRAGGSAPIAILVLALVLGNAAPLSRALRLPDAVELPRDVLGLHAQVVFVVKTFFFAYMGMALAPPWGPVALGAAVAGLLALVRIPAVSLAALGGGFAAGERALLAASCPRGLAAGVLAALPAAAGVPDAALLPPLVFAGVLATLVLHAVAWPLARRKLDRPPAAPAAFAAEPSAPPPPAPPPRPPITTGKFQW